MDGRLVGLRLGNAECVVVADPEGHSDGDREGPLERVGLGERLDSAAVGEDVEVEDGPFVAIGDDSSDEAVDGSQVGIDDDVSDGMNEG